MYNYAFSDELYVVPNIEKWLVNLGLANLTAVKGVLNVFVWEGIDPYGTNRSIPIPIAPIFLTSLREVGSLKIREACWTCFGYYDLPPVSRLTALPGLVNLKQVYRAQLPFYSNTWVIISGTAFTDMRSLAGLTCSPTLFLLYNNTLLKTLDGLQQLATPYTGAADFVATDSGPFTTAESVAALKGIAACYGDFSGGIDEGFVSIPAGCNATLSSWTDVCAFKGTPTPCPFG
jgi:hypothetical protein